MAKLFNPQEQQTRPYTRPDVELYIAEMGKLIYDDCFEFEKELSALLARYSASGIMFVNVRGGVVVPLGESE